MKLAGDPFPLTYAEYVPPSNCDHLTLSKHHNIKRGVGSKWEWTQAWHDGWVMREDGLFLAQGVGGGGGGNGREQRDGDGAASRG